ncbi:shikimate dehydrogenase [Cobetia sp. 5-25-4-2]|uniref:shikimate dehydrogenase n=1 Tax=Cobetia sp. 5-25-4-2 TaxID=2737459 RepID=UPI0015964FE3|nr:shikimate dehydrogenase [Cobetia sp. 5-25-4-2]
MMSRYAVFGNPIAHSKSPLIHRAFAEQLKDSLSYEARLAPVDDFAAGWAEFVAEGGQGANVTMPFKEQAYRLVEVLSPRARRAGAVNTLLLGKNGQLYGDTTDGVGLTRDLERLEAPLTDARILILGAGGAVRGVLEPLLAKQPAALVVANRTAAKASALAEDFADLAGDGCQLSGGSYEAIEGQFDLVINGTSASLGGELPPLPDSLFSSQALAYDMMYAAEPTVFMRWASEQGARGEDGLGMLVEQAAESYFLWRHKRPDTAPVADMLRKMLVSG